MRAPPGRAAPASSSADDVKYSGCRSRKSFRRFLTRMRCERDGEGESRRDRGGLVISAGGKKGIVKMGDAESMSSRSHGGAEGAEGRLLRMTCGVRGALRHGAESSAAELARVGQLASQQTLQANIQTLVCTSKTPFVSSLQAHSEETAPARDYPESIWPAAEYEYPLKNSTRAGALVPQERDIK